ncbi:uncharacterized protein [Nicotiana sylvestris]|uniref:uncharacterized protein n=1 Tax=Nicotiana sylvestris TaxID=4096 RepID=UPI00388CD99A
MPTGKLAKWQILLSEFNIVYITQKAVKGQALLDHLAENPVGAAYKPLKTYFPDKEVSFVGEDITEAYDGWRMFFDRAANFKGEGIGAVLVSEMGQHYLVQGEWAAKNSKIFPYLHHVQELRKRFMKIEFRYVPRIQNEFADALATLSSMIQHPDKNYIDPIPVKIHNHPAYYAHVEEEADGKPWFHDIKKSVEFRHIPQIHNVVVDALATLASMWHHPDKTCVDPLNIDVRDQHDYCNMVEEELDGEPWFYDINEYIKSGVYPVNATSDQKRTIRRLASGVFLSGGIFTRGLQI